MSLTHDTMMELMAYADGELAGDDDAHARIEALLATSDEARRVLEALGAPAIGAWLEGSSIGAAKADGIADAVMAKIEASSTHGATPQALRARAGVSDLSAARETRAARIRYAAAFAAIAAVAAGVLAYVGTESPSPQKNRSVATVVPAEAPLVPSPQVTAPTPAPTPDDSNAVASADTEGVEVNEVETPSRDVSVFYLPSTVGATANMNPTSVVVWLGDDNNGGR